MTELDIKIAELREEIARIENDPNNDGEDLNSLITELAILEVEKVKIKNL